VIAELSIVPIGAGKSLSAYIAKAVGIIENSGLAYKVTDFGTVIEGNLREVMSVAKRCHCYILKECEKEQGVGRVQTTIRLDERTDKKYHLEDKVNSVAKKLGKKGCCR
jgi:uncharacterized protein (TIGR00106 family)